MFDTEELEVLNTLKLKFIQMNEQIKSAKKKEEKIQETIKPQEGQRMSKPHGESD